jgi:uncharacterized Zn finger protein (UPF0148 family)
MPRQHECTNYIDVRFHGADDHDGETYCAVCGEAYSADELSAMHAAIQSEPERRAA